MKSPDYSALLREWLSESLIDSGQPLITIRSACNLYSRTYVFSTPGARSDSKYFVKMLESRNGVDDDTHFDAEIEALSLAQDINFKNRILVPRLYRHSKSLKAVVSEYVEGENLYNKIWNRRRLCAFLLPWSIHDIRLLHDLVCWMQLFHDSLAGKVHACPSEEVISRDFDSMVKRRSFLKEKRIPAVDMSLIENAIETAERFLKKLKPCNREIVLIHGDLTLSNMIASGEKVYVLDFAHSKPGMPEDDFSRIICDIVSMGPVAALRHPGFPRKDFIGDLFRSFLKNLSHGDDLLWFYLVKNSFVNLTTYANNLGGGSGLRGLRFLILLQIQQKFLRRILENPNIL